MSSFLPEVMENILIFGVFSYNREMMLSFSVTLTWGLIKKISTFFSIITYFKYYNNKNINAPKGFIDNFKLE